MSSVPVRFDPVTADAELLRQRNRAERRTGPFRFTNSEGTLARIAAAHASTDDDRKRDQAWVSHPDERVAIACLRHPPLWQGRPGAAPRAGHEIVARLAYARGTAERQEGILWNPVLDALAASGHWPATVPSLPTAPEPMAAAVDRLAPWIVSQSDPRVVESLLAFRAPALRALVCLRMRAPDRETVGRVLALPDFWSAGAAALAANPELDEGAARHLLATLTARCQTTPDDPSFDATQVGVALARLETRGYRLTLPERSMMLGQGAVSTPTDPLVAHQVRRVLLELPSLTADDLRALTLCELAVRGTTDADAVRWVAHPAATPAVWHALAEGCQAGLPGREVFQVALATHPPARAVPAVRAVLARVPSLDVAQHLWADDTDAAFQLSVHMLVLHGAFLRPDGGALLRALPPERLGLLTRAQWSGLLWASTDRRFAMDALSSIPSARRDPEARRAVTGVFDLPRTLRVAADPEVGTPEERRALALRVLTHRWSEALDWLDGASSEAASIFALLQPDDLLPLLQSSDTRLRQRGLVWVARQHGAASALSPIQTPPPTHRPLR